MIELRVAKSAGFCYGVSRSVEMTRELLSSGKCCSLGEVVHNADVMSTFERDGLTVINDPSELPTGGRCIIRAHGASREEIEALESRGAEITDATCPNVDKIHRIVEAASIEGRCVFIIGAAEHPEVKGICGWCDAPVVVANAAELAEVVEGDVSYRTKPTTFVVQTTQTAENLNECEKLIKNVFTNAKVFDTICFATSTRQEEAVQLASECDAMIVIGGRHSANSVHLAELCRSRCVNTQFVENVRELDMGALSAAKSIGVTAGASAPAWIIKEVLDMLNEEEMITKEETHIEETPAPEIEISKAEEPVAEKPEEEKTFDELLEDSLKPIYNGDKVEGTVVAISPTEVSVDLGTKYQAFIPVDELTEDGSKVEEMFHIGDIVAAIVVRVNDVEGTAQLSKKRLDAVKVWADIEQASEDGTIVEGVVTEDNKGGIVVTVRGIRVFVPASQSGLPKEAEMSSMLKEKVRLKITEVNRARKRVVGSIRAVAQRERREKAENVWNEIEVGKVYEGVVKSLTSYGAFVDIGGVDGMVHVSELSWERIKQPSDIVAVGDPLTVHVISFDKDTHRISLGCKTEAGNPWVRFVDTYKTGDVVGVKIVKLMPFGAFAEVMPGVDGLIHISQIANRRIGQPSEVLSVGQDVEAKITAIDMDKQKISLSIRALSEPEPAPKAEDEEASEESGDDALVFEVSADGQVSGNMPEEADQE